MVHDAFSEGLIYGLRDQYVNFNPEHSLRANLDGLARQGKIFMTESLNLVFGETALDVARALNREPRVDVKNPHHFAHNAMTIGMVAREMTEQQLKEGVSWMPQHLLEGLSEAAMRTKVYGAIRNYVYTKLARIKPGSHELLEHTEVLVNEGPTSALYNRENILFYIKLIQATLMNKM